MEQLYTWFIQYIAVWGFTVSDQVKPAQNGHKVYHYFSKEYAALKSEAQVRSNQDGFPVSQPIAIAHHLKISQRNTSL